MRRLPLLFLAGGLTAMQAFAGTVDFDSVSVTCCYSDVTPGGNRGPFLDYGTVTFDGGVIMNGDTGWGGMETTPNNLYGTSDTSALADASLLPGTITISFVSPTDFVTLDVINGTNQDPTTVTLSAYDSSNAFLGSTSVDLTAYRSVGSVKNAALNLAGMKTIIITSNQGEGATDFAIDTVSFTDSAVPEPTTWFSLGGGLVALGYRRIRAKRS